MTMVFALLLAAAPSRAQPPDGDAALKVFLQVLKENPAEINLESMAEQLSLYPGKSGVKIAEELFKARPGSPSLKIALARAYCAAGDTKRGLGILEDMEDTSLAADAELRERVIKEFERCGAPERAFFYLSRQLKACMDPNECSAILERMGEFAHRVAGSDSVLSAFRRDWRAQIASGSSEIKPYRLLAQSDAAEGDPALESLCADAIARFPREPAFYALLADGRTARGDWAGLVSARLEAISALPRVTSGDYLDLADAYLLWGRPEKAAGAMRRGRLDARLDASGKQELEDKLQVLAAVAPTLPAPVMPQCSYSESVAERRVDCGGIGLEYSVAAGAFSGQENQASALTLAEHLLERVEEKHFTTRAAASHVPADVRANLKAAGYLP